MTAKAGKPNPGSDAARKAGCTCAVLDNNHGLRAPYPPDGWWITDGCPVHAPRPKGRLSLSDPDR